MSTLSDLRDQWFGDADTAGPAHAARHRVASELRAIAADLVACDVERIDAAEFHAAIELATGLRERTATWPRHDPSPATAPLPDGALVERSPVSGRGNPLAPPLTYDFDGETTRAWCVFSGAYEGPPGGVHGGAVAAALDEVLGVAQMAAGVAGFTGTLTVRYHRITPVGRRIEFSATPAEQDGRKVCVRASVTADGEIVAEAEGLFISQVAL